jgi:hypothetical protein
MCVCSGFIYFAPTAFGELSSEYECPQCAAPKSRFAEYDAETGKTKGTMGGVPQIVNVVGAVGLVATIALVVLGFSS